MSSRLGWILLFSGLGSGLVGVMVLAHNRRKQQLEGLGQDVPRLGPPTPIVETQAAGGMTVQHRRSKRMPIEERVRNIQNLVWESVKDPRMIKLAREITYRAPERDGEREARAIYDAVKARIRYAGDIAPVRQPNGIVEPIDLYQSAWRTWEFKGGDCLPTGTLLLTDRHELVPIERLVIGQKIWGRDAWTEVKDVWAKGPLPIDVVFLNNGSSFKATADHKVYVALCARHPKQHQLCACPVEERSIERLRVSQLEPGMVLIQPEQIAFGTEAQDPRRAYVEGLYLADGWMSHACDFEISGQDGQPKEAQKREVEEICRALDIETRWHRKYIAIKDGAWAERIAQMGGRAPEKRALSIALDEPAARELLRGILADSGKNTHGNGRTFTTTSRELMLQVRMLCRMVGISCSERYIVDHGGLGTNPIWRLGLRDQDRSDGKREKLLRVKSVEREALVLPTYDLQTADHYVYLPEADVTVSNCDDHSILVATLLSINGITAKLRVTATGKNEDWSHIYVVAELPKFAPKKRVALDTTLPGINHFGREVPFAKHLDFPV